MVTPTVVSLVFITDADSELTVKARVVMECTASLRLRVQAVSRVFIRATVTACTVKARAVSVCVESAAAGMEYLGVPLVIRLVGSTARTLAPDTVATELLAARPTVTACTESPKTIPGSPDTRQARVGLGYPASARAASAYR